MIEKEKVMVDSSNDYKVILDIHTHTLASGHAYGTIREMAYEAEKKGLKLLGISEHGPGIPGTCDTIYFTNLDKIPKKFNDVEILHGCEINVLNDGTLSLEEKYIDMLDYAIVGIHRQCYKDVGVEKNTENLISCMKNEKVYFVSHPDDDYTALDYEKLVKAAKQYHVALEVNNSSLLKQDQRLNCVKNYKEMLKLCQDYKLPIIVSSDAHDPSCVGVVSEACKLLKELEFDKSLIINTSIDKFKEFIGR